MSSQIASSLGSERAKFGQLLLAANRGISYNQAVIKSLDNFNKAVSLALVRFPSAWPTEQRTLELTVNLPKIGDCSLSSSVIQRKPKVVLLGEATTTSLVMEPSVLNIRLQEERCRLGTYHKERIGLTIRAGFFEEKKEVPIQPPILIIEPNGIGDELVKIHPSLPNDPVSRLQQSVLDFLKKAIDLVNSAS